MYLVHICTWNLFQILSVCPKKKLKIETLTSSQEASILNGNHESSRIVPPNRQCQDVSCIVSPNSISDNGRPSHNEIEVSIISPQVNANCRNIFKKHDRNNDKDCLPSYTDAIRQDSNN